MSLRSLSSKFITIYVHLYMTQEVTQQLNNMTQQLKYIYAGH